MAQKKKNPEIKSDFISLKEAVKYCDYTQEYLSLRARQGKLKAVKFARNWLTKKEWIEEYIREMEEYERNQRNQRKQIEVKPKLEEKALFVKGISISLSRISFFPKLKPALSLALILLLLFTSIALGKESFKNILQDTIFYVQQTPKTINHVLKESKKSLASSLDSLNQSFINLAEVIKTTDYQDLKTPIPLFKEYFQWSVTNLKSIFVQKPKALAKDILDYGNRIFLKIVQGLNYQVLTFRKGGGRFVKQIKEGILEFGQATKDLTLYIYNLALRTPDLLVRRITEAIPALVKKIVDFGSYTSDKFKKGWQFLVLEFQTETKELKEFVIRLFKPRITKEKPPEKEILVEVTREEFEKLKQEIEKLKEEGLPVREVVKEIEVSRITKVEPIKEITKEIKTLDGESLKKIQTALLQQETDVGKLKLAASLGYVRLPTILSLSGDISIITLGTITTGVWNASTITVPYGGTGLTSVPVGYTLIGDSSNALQATSALFIASDGNVGIGTTEPGTLLTLRRTDAGNVFAIRNTANTADTFTITDAGVVNLGTWQGTAIGTRYGGTGQDFSAVDRGNIIYFSGAGVMANLAPGVAGQFLQTQGAGDDPVWAAAGGGGAPTDAQYVTLAVNATLTDERVLTAGTNISFTDTGPDGTLTIATVANPEFAGLTLSGLSGVLKAAAGVVSGSATTSDLPEGTNLYFTDARAQAAITGGASTIVTSDLTINRALISSGTGKVAVSAVTATELGYVGGVTTAIQTQLDAKEGTITAGTTAQYWRGDKTWQDLTTAVVSESGNLYFTDARAQAAITGGASTIVTSDLTINRALISSGTGKVAVSAVTATELGYVGGVTTAIQTQLDAKVGGSGTINYLAKFTAATTLGDSIIYDDGTNVGIGTTSPNARLQINPTVTATADLTSFKSGLVYNGATAMTNWYGGYIAAPTGTGTITNKYAFVTEANSGNVGIGTTSPGAKLTVAGSAQIIGHLYEDQPFSYAGKKIVIISPYVTKTNEYKGELHTHTTNSDGTDTPTALETAYKDAGYDFVAITDHDYLTSDPNVSGILHINGVEETATEGHIISIGTSAQTDLTPAQDIIDYIIGDDAVPSMAHPNASVAPSWTDTELESIDGYLSIEVYSGGGLAEDKWDALLTKYKRAFGMAVDDCHDVAGSYFNKGWVKVFADSLTSSDIVDALKRGNFYSSTGSTLSISVSKTTITATTNSSSTITWIGSGGNTLQSASNVTSDSYTVIGNEVYVRVKITRDSDSKNAWANPIYIYQTPTSELSKGGLIRGNTYITGNVGIGTTAPNVSSYTGTVLTVGAGETSLVSAIEIYGQRSGDDGTIGADLTFLNASATGSDKRVAIIRGLRLGDDDSGGLRFYSRDAGSLVIAVDINNSGNVGIGTTSPTNILSLGNAAAQKFWIENSATDVVGRALTVAAGGTIAGTSVSDVTGGNLILQAGLGTGTGASTISFQTGTTLTTGTTLQTMSTKMTILGSGNVGIGTTAPNVSGYSGTVLTVGAGATDLVSAVEIYGQRSGDDGVIGAELTFLNISATGTGPDKRIAMIRGIRSGNDSSGGLKFYLKSTTGSWVVAVTIDNSGNVGIGDQTPSYILDVVQGSATDPHADAWLQHSAREYKTNIQELSNGLGLVKGLKIYSFNRIGADGGIDDAYYVGLIADEAPPELKADEQSVNPNNWIAFNALAIQELSEEVEELKLVLNDNGLLTSGKGIVENPELSLLASFGARVKQALANLGIFIENGIVRIKELVVEKLKIGSQEQPSGITLYDEETGEPYCVKMKRGELISLAGECDNNTEVGPMENSPEATGVEPLQDEPEEEPLEEANVEEVAPPQEERPPAAEEPAPEPELEPEPEPQPEPGPEPISETIPAPEPEPESESGPTVITEPEPTP